MAQSPVYPYNPDSTITREELYHQLAKRSSSSTNGVRFGGYYSLPNLVNEVVNDIMKFRKHADPCGDDEKETFTKAEIGAAMARMGYGRVHVDDITANIKAHREPEWAVGDVVRDAGGKFFERLDKSGGYVWKSMSGGIHKEYEPKRPLKRMVEEA